MSPEEPVIVTIITSASGDIRHICVNRTNAGATNSLYNYVKGRWSTVASLAGIPIPEDTEAAISIYFDIDNGRPASEWEYPETIHLTIEE